MWFGNETPTLKEPQNSGVNLQVMAGPVIKIQNNSRLGRDTV